MSMAWHHIAFDPSLGFGFGEYTFAVPGKFQVHGITAIQLKDSLIHRWREYQTASGLSFEQFAGDSLAV